MVLNNWSIGLSFQMVHGPGLVGPYPLSTFVKYGCWLVYQIDP